MNLFDIIIERSKNYDFDPTEALARYGGMENLYEALEDIQRRRMVHDIHSVRLMVPRGSKELALRLQTDKAVSREMAVDFLLSREVPVS